MFGVVYGAPESAPAAIVAVAREFSPRVEIYGPREVALDLHGVARLFGDAAEIGRELRRTAADRGLRVRIAIAATRTAARLIVRHRAGVTVIAPGTEAAALAPLPLALLDALANDPNAPNVPNAPNDSVVPSLRRWGLRTLGEFAALAPDAVAARLGQVAVQWQRVAAGEDPRPLVPASPEERFEQALDLEWPIEGLEPLSFVLGRLLEPLAAHLERRDRGAAVLHVRLHLVTRVVHERSLQLPVAMRDARTLRTLALLDLESHPPDAAIDRAIVAVDPTPARVVQYSLLTRPLPSPEQVSTLVARLTALMGEGRCGAPAAVDSWQPGAFAMTPFAPVDSRGGDPAGPAGPTHRQTPGSGPVVALRRFRFPVPARVRMDEGQPARVMTDRRGVSGGAVAACAGPWRTSGAWWLDGGEAWDGDEWDVALTDGVAYRLFRDRAADRWFVAGIID